MFFHFFSYFYNGFGFKMEIFDQFGIIPIMMRYKFPPVSFFLIYHPDVPTPFSEQSIFSPSIWKFPFIIILVWLKHIFGLFLNFLICCTAMAVQVLAPHCFNYSSFILWLNISNRISSSLVSPLESCLFLIFLSPIGTWESACLILKPICSFTEII